MEQCVFATHYVPDLFVCFDRNDSETKEKYQTEN